MGAKALKTVNRTFEAKVVYYYEPQNQKLSNTQPI